MEPFGTDLGQLAEGDNTMPFGALLTLPILDPAIAGGHRKSRKRIAAAAIFHLGVSPQMPNQNHLVYSCHYLTSFLKV